MRNMRGKYYKYKNANYGSSSGGDHFLMIGDGNGTLGYSPHP